MNDYKEYTWEEGATSAHSYLYEDLKIIMGNNRNMVILDVGCGNGEIANRLLSEGYNVYGIDGSKSGIKIAQRKYKDHFYVQDINSVKLPAALQKIKFDMIISTEVIEHLYEPRAYIQFCKNILMRNGGGDLILSTPYHGYLKNLIMALAGKMDKHFTVLWDGGHIKFWSRKTLTQLFNEAGFEVTAFKGSGRFPYLWKSMFLRAHIA